MCSLLKVEFENVNYSCQHKTDDLLIFANQDSMIGQWHDDRTMAQPKINELKSHIELWIWNSNCKKKKNLNVLLLFFTLDLNQISFSNLCSVGAVLVVHSNTGRTCDILLLHMHRVKQPVAEVSCIEWEPFSISDNGFTTTSCQPP